MLPPDRIVRVKTVVARSGLSRSTIYRKIVEGTFPARIRISSKGTGWRESDIDRWVADPEAWRSSGKPGFDDRRREVQAAGRPHERSR